MRGRMGDMPLITQADNTLLALVGVLTGILAVILGVLVAKRRIRFGVRTLLIVMTLVAVGLGAIVWLSARPPAAPSIDQADLPDF